MEQLTPIQSKVLAYLGKHIRDNGYSPTIREIQHRFKWASVNSAFAHVKALERKGLVRKTPRGYVPV